MPKSFLEHYAVKRKFEGNSRTKEKPNGRNVSSKASVDRSFGSYGLPTISSPSGYIRSHVSHAAYPAPGLLTTDPPRNSHSHRFRGSARKRGGTPAGRRGPNGRSFAKRFDYHPNLALQASPSRRQNAPWPASRQ